MSARKIIFGLALILIGTLLLGRTLNIFFFDFGDIVGIAIPFGLIGLGIWLIVRKRQQQQRMDEHVQSYSQGFTPPPPPPPPPPGSSSSHAFASSGPTRTETPRPETAKPSSDSDRTEGPETRGQQSHSSGFRASAGPTSVRDDKIKYDKAFGDMYVDLKGVNMRSVEVSSFIGDLEIRVHDADLQEGLNRLIVSVFMGDIRIYIPPDFPVFASCSNFGGDVEVMDRRQDGFGNNLELQTPTYEEAPKKLYVAANSFLGDIRIMQI